MKIGHLLLLVGIILGAFAAFWLLSQRRGDDYTLERYRDIPSTWIELE
jgi:hypothetical protein